MNDNYDIKTYRRLRRAVGYLGISLPIALVILSLIPFFETHIQSSISKYYYTNLREIFTGILCAVGLFLIRYEGFKGSKIWRNDDLLTNIAGFMAICVAFFPTNPTIWNEKIYTLIPLDLAFLGWLHYGFAAFFFIILATMSIWVFTIGQVENEEIPISIINENNIYKTCGILIFVFIALIPIFMVLDIFSFSTLILEALALFSFGISWLVKGRALPEKSKLWVKIYREFNT